MTKLDSHLTATLVSLFPESVAPYFNASVLGKAQAKQKFTFSTVNYRDFATDAYKGVDDTPCGGGPGQVIRIDIAVSALNEALKGKERSQTRVILMDPAGPSFTAKHAKSLAQYEHLIFVCGRYEGVDSRIYNYVDESISIGDFVLTSGELACAVVLDAVLRFVPEVLGNAASATNESHSENLLEHSQYTRPIEYDGHKVPDWLLSGNHKKIEELRRAEQLLRTLEVRPDLLSQSDLTSADAKLLQKFGLLGDYPWRKTNLE